MTMKNVFALFLSGIVGGFIALSADRWTQRTAIDKPLAASETEAQVQYVNMPVHAPALGDLDLTVAAERSVNAVVHVTTEAMVRRDPLMDFFWGYRPSAPSPRQGAGSGVIVADDGYIVTNNHVVQGADRIRVHLNDGRSFEASVVGTDPSTDIALIKVDARELPTMEFGNSDMVRVGEWVLAVGNPMNLTSTVTAGIVSAKARNINLLQYDPARDIFPIESFIQTDAAVNPGNSGGALVNTNGELVGINTAIASATGQYTGYSFAVPVNIVKKVTSDLLEYGNVQRAYIGVSIRNMDQDLASEASLDRIRGVFIQGLSEGGAAEAAGMRSGDVLLKVGNIEVNSVPELQEQVSKFRPGDKVAVTVARNGKEQIMDVVLRGRDGSLTAERSAAPTTATLLGAQLVRADASELRSLDLEHGVKVESVVGGKFRSSGIRDGFIITRIDQEGVKDPEDVQRILKGKRGGVLIEGVYPNGTRAYYGLGV
ncbi:MAG: trypsin-like peptidase domain-containing protein [Flavobacteriales bacterium]|nr:trypsin-like peptidase domain-containing protein [Flavobacteriales bacterium]